MVLRKLLHLSLVIPLFIFKSLSHQQVLWVLASLAGLSLIIEFLRIYSPAFRHRFIRLLSPLLKEKERGGNLTGATYLFLSFLIVFLIFPFKIFFYASLIAILVDGLTPLLTAFLFNKNSKDHTHFFVFFIAAVIVAFVVNSGLSIWVKLGGSVLIAVLEYLDFPPDDNFWAELGGALIIYTLIHLI